MSWTWNIPLITSHSLWNSFVYYIIKAAQSLLLSLDLWLFYWWISDEFLFAYNCVLMVSIACRLFCHVLKIHKVRNKTLFASFICFFIIFGKNKQIVIFLKVREVFLFVQEEEMGMGKRERESSMEDEEEHIGRTIL